MKSVIFRSRTVTIPAELPAVAVPVFERLCAWREGVAKEMGIPPYVIFIDNVLRDIAIHMPTTLDELQWATGGDEHKLKTFGPSVLQTLAESD